MKVITFLIVAVFFCAPVNAQSFYSISAGVNTGEIVTEINGKKDDAIKGAIGYTVKTNIYIPVAKSLLVQCGVEYETVSNKVNTDYSNTVGGTTIKETFTGKSFLGYIQIPLRLTYSLPAGKGRFFAGAGPYAGIGVGGRSKSTEIIETTLGPNTTRSEYNYNKKVSFGDADTSIKRINMGLGLNLSYATVGNLLFSLYANKGLNNINNRTNYNTKTWSAGITVGYLFKNRE
ncbi:MAG: outer membrane beta-barrel protein [Ferruginibacter sp.]